MPERAATHANYWSAFIAGAAGIFGSLTLNDWAAIVGIGAGLAAIATAIVNWWFRLQHLKLARTTVRLQLKAEDE